MKKDLKVIVPKEFKEDLSKRFDPDEAVLEMDEYYIRYPCPFCKKFLPSCEGCPFSRFGDGIQAGCILWIYEIVGKLLYFYIGITRVMWDKDFDKEARKQIQKLRKGAQRLITWI